MVSLQPILFLKTCLVEFESINQQKIDLKLQLVVAKILGQAGGLAKDRLKSC